ncbi:MAG TPA: M13 family metallopeptidase N-terminal domain-containing protein, partial [Caulobacteraceae bacterium]|nr:M13 family metallopeptidase N-terminal domain-containing protein [Caulobacteraceae bacterium]
MKTLLGLAALGAAAAVGLGATLGLAAASSAASLTGPQIPPWGFDLAGRDLSVAPGADFYAHANGTYVRKLVIPPDRSRYGAFDALQALSETRVHGILERAAANPEASGEERKIGAFYRSFMDEGRANALGAKPIAPELAAIRAADTREKLAALMGDGVKSFYGSMFDIDISVDAKDPAHYAVELGQSGLGLPNRDYYLEAGFAPQKAKYQAYVAQMLKLADWPDADAEAAAVVDMETRIAKASWTLAQERDPTKTYNPMTPAELAKAAPGFDWSAYLAAAELGDVPRVVVNEVDAVPQIAAVFAATPVKTLQAWQAFNVTDSAAPFLSQPFVDANFEFRAKTLSGQQ